MPTATRSPERITYRPREVAELTGLSLQNVYDCIRRGELRAVRVRSEEPCDLPRSPGRLRGRGRPRGTSALTAAALSPKATVMESESPSTYGLALLPQHQAKLAESAVSAEIVRERGYVSADTKAQLERYGFKPAQRRVPALIIPIHGVDGQPADTRYVQTVRGR